MILVTAIDQYVANLWYQLWPLTSMWLIAQPTQRNVHVSDQLDHDKNTKSRTTKKKKKKKIQ